MDQQLINDVVNEIKADVLNQDYTAIQELIEQLIMIDIRVNGRVCAAFDAYVTHER